MSESPYPTGVYVKGDDERVATTAARAVSLVFEGYKLREDKSVEESAAPAAEPVSETAPVTDTPTAPTPKAPRRAQTEQ